MSDPTPANGTYTGLGQNIDANSIAQITKFMTEKMDEIIAIEAKTNGMQADPAFVRATSTAGVVKLATMETTGLGNYSKVKGYPVGGVNLTWQEYTLSNDRAISATIDRRDTQVTDGLVTAAAALAETMRTQVVPEIDATRMAKLWYELDAQSSANSNVATGAAPTKANIVSKLTTGINAIADATGIEDGMTIYINSSLRTVVDTAEGFTWMKDISGGNQSLDTRIREFRGNKIVFVPSTRMYTKIDLNDGFTGVYPDDSAQTPAGLSSAAYGYAEKSGSKDIWFAITTPGVANAVTAINATKVIPAEVNQKFDGDTYMYRIFHDLIVPKNKCKAAYMSIEGA